MNLRSGHPFWLLKNGLLADYPSLKQNESCEVAVIGGGITGALVAYYLVQEGVETVLTELAVHSKLEEELIYPAIRAEIDDDDLMDEALEEHHVVHGLLVELKKMKPSDERYDAKFTVLAENVRHHIKEEESEMFPKAEDCEIDWDALCSQVVKRRFPWHRFPKSSESCRVVSYCAWVCPMPRREGMRLQLQTT